MKTFYLISIFLLLEKSDAAVVRKDPAFATPRYSDSYIPAVMQVIFNGIEQYRIKQLEEAEMAATSTTIPTTISHSPGQQQPMPVMLMNEKPSVVQEASENETEKPSDNVQSTLATIDEKPETAETPESIYGTPETNHETPEEMHEMQEINHEIPQIVENNHEISDVNSNDKLETTTISLNSKPQQNNQSNSSSEDSSLSSSSSSSSSEEKEKDDKNKAKKPSIDSVVEEIYEIMKPKNKSKNSSEESSDDSSKSIESEESTEDDSDEDENDENRFTLLGEKVTQVPRPSLSTYLRRSKLSSNSTTFQDLASLYDSLSRYLRKLGYAKYAGYSDAVLETLQTSAEGGFGPQIKKLLDEIVKRDEVTREDTKIKIAETLECLKDPNSQFNRDISTLLPLRFNS